jgi:hypothetical protein
LEQISSAYPSTHLNRKTQEIEAGLGGVHDMGLGHVQTEVKSFHYMTQHLPWLIDSFSTQESYFLHGVCAIVGWQDRVMAVCFRPAIDAS